MPLSDWHDGIATNYGGAQDGMNPYDPSFGTKEVSVDASCPNIASCHVTSAALVVSLALVAISVWREGVAGKGYWCSSVFLEAPLPALGKMMLLAVLHLTSALLMSQHQLRPRRSPLGACTSA